MIHHDLIVDIALTPIENPTAKIVLLALASYSNASGECFPSQQKLAEDTAVSERTVRSCIQWLQANGYIEIKRSPNRPSVYTITSMKEEDMPSKNGPAKFAGEVDSNITKLDISKKDIAKSYTTSAAKSAHPRDTPLFSAFWQAYPRRIGKGAARVAFERATKFVDGNDLIQAAIKFSEHCEKMGIEPRFIPYPSTWLNGERWEDDLETETATPRKQEKWIDEL